MILSRIVTHLANILPERAIIFGIACSISLAGFTACDEALPTYRDPRDVFKGEVQGRYAFSRTENNMRIDLFVINTYDETFEAKATMEGSGTITLRRDVSFTKTFKLSAANWARGRYNPTTGRLTMNPGDTLVLVYTWDYRDDLGRDWRSGFMRGYPDPRCTARTISDKEVFSLRFRLKVFDKVADVESKPTDYEFCYISAWIDPKACTTIRADLPCSQW